MIRINLLPFRAARRKENIRRQVSVFFLLLVFTLVSLFYYTNLVDRKIERLNISIVQINSEIALYKEKADKVTEIKRKLDILDKKLGLVATLESQRREALILLDAMTQLVVPERMWLTNLKTDDISVTIKGMAFDNKTVADFMTRLEGSTLFNGVDLKKLEMKNLNKELEMKAFEVLCKKAVPQTDEKPDKGEK